MSTVWPQLEDAQRSVAGIAGLARAVRQAAACADGPLALRRACDAATVRVSRGRLRVADRHHTAMLVPTRDGFHAVVNDALWDHATRALTARRQFRFVVAHELGHTFFYRPGRPPTRTRPADRLEERFCQQFADELLVPSPAALQAPLDPVGLHALAGRYEVPTWVAARAIARVRPEVTLLWLRRAEHPRRGGDERMRVQWGASQRFVARGESFKSALAELAPGEHGETVEDLLLAGRCEPVQISAWRFQSAMLAVIRPRPLDVEGSSVRQLALF